MTPQRAALFIVATPIGNLGDMSPRAIKTLNEVDIIAAEDTRRAGQLLSHFDIKGKRLISYYDHVEKQKAEPLIQKMIDEDLMVALISDAGTPCVSDPGYRLVEMAMQKGVAVHPIPGASALTALISASGLPSDRFLFVGFLPTKKGALKAEINSWRHVGGSVIFYEAPRRLSETFMTIAEIYPQALVAVGREITKLHEEMVRMPIREALSWSQMPTSLRGEAAVMIYPAVQLEHAEDLPDDAKWDEAMLLEQARRGYEKGLSLKDMLDKFKDCGFNRSDLYRLLLQAKLSDDAQ
jgi:16S rRNA (cytidine1402-2'-O)-methyltransferase